MLNFTNLSRFLFNKVGIFFKGWEFLFYPKSIADCTEQAQQKSDSVQSQENITLSGSNGLVGTGVFKSHYQHHLGTSRELSSFCIFCPHKEILALAMCTYVFPSVTIPFWQRTQVENCPLCESCSFIFQRPLDKSVGNNSLTWRPTRVQINELGVKG